MPVHFRWKDDKQRAITYIVDGDWNWKDYHQAVRASAFTLARVDHPVDSVIDLRQSARADLPAGAPAHLRSFGRVSQPCLTGRAAVIGLPTLAAARLDLGPGRTLPTADGFAQFVDSEAELERLLAEWAADPPAT
ncbi:MAG: hypothetical protein OXG84_16705 [Chloroflexi bacterium]|nr:hypothetical protein [Chloroflexota bacterium]